eukprot:TRINITY_DN2663_c4_g1_i1.p1 TRINITY_DN2663_c4_g1~~TRINITY_DN2663_c4_g1_i1.p1  ORF type:complete len:594 (+),score=78.71 TRINITY_DN2663_c4_g1_i1:47-1828(+)
MSYRCGDQLLKGVASRHALREYVGKSMTCPGCKQNGPSPQTGCDECAWCRLCERCLAEGDIKNVCIITGLQEANDPLEKVSWRVKGVGEFSLSRPMIHNEDGKRACEGYVLFTDETQESIPIKIFRISYSESPPKLKLGNAQRILTAVAPLPTNCEVLLPQIVTVLNCEGVSHEVPMFVDRDCYALPKRIKNFSNSPIVDVLIAPRGDHIISYHVDRTIRMAKCQGPGSQALLKWTIFETTAKKPCALEDEKQFRPQKLMDISPDLRHLAVTGRPPKVYQPTTCTFIRAVYHDSDPEMGALSVAFSSSGRFLIVVYTDYSATILNPTNGNVATTIASNLLEPYKAGETAVAFSNSSGMLAMSARCDNQFGIVVVTGWRVYKNTIKFWGGPHRSTIVSVQFSPDDSGILVASVTGIITVSDTEGTILKEIRHPEGKQLTKAQFTGAGKRVVSLTEDGTVWFWDRRGLQTVLRQSDYFPKNEIGASVCMDVAPLGKIALGTESGSPLLLPSPTHCYDRSAHTSAEVCRPAHQHCGQRASLLFVHWQTSLKALALPEGVQLLRLLPQDDLRTIVSFMPDPYAGDRLPDDDSNCVLM